MGAVFVAGQGMAADDGGVQLQGLLAVILFVGAPGGRVERYGALHRVFGLRGELAVRGEGLRYVPGGEFEALGCRQSGFEGSGKSGDTARGDVGDDPVAPVVQYEDLADRGCGRVIDAVPAIRRRPRVLAERLDSVLDDPCELLLEQARVARLLFEGTVAVVLDGLKSHVGEEESRKDDRGDEEQGQFEAHKVST